MKHFNVVTLCLIMIGLMTYCQNDKSESSTSKDDTESYEESDIKIEIDSPEMYTSYHSGDDVIIKGKIESKEKLHGYSILILQKSDNKEVFTKKVHDHSESYDFSEKWINDVHGMQDMELIISVVINHENLVKTQSVLFHCHGKM